MQKRKCGEIVTFGSYMQDAGTSVKMPIEWIVLESDDEGMLLLSRKVLDCKPFHEGRHEDVTWEKSSLRAWLNESFYNMAFNEEEKKKVLLARNTTPAIRINMES